LAVKSETIGRGRHEKVNASGIQSRVGRAPLPLKKHRLDAGVFPIKSKIDYPEQ